MDNIDINILKALVFKVCEKDPHLVSTIIDTAAEGVKSFANKQSDKSSKMAFMMSQILDNTQGDFGVFKRKDIVEIIAPWFSGTEWYEKLKC
jgi:hypothetical protein